MAMSKKDYERIAAEIRFVMPVDGCAQKDTLWSLAQNLAEQFKLDNPRFDRARFLKACGIGEGE